MDTPLPADEHEWKEKLTPEQYKVLREAGTERPFSSPLLLEKRDGVYRCAACGAPLFDAHTKFDSGTGWPSFDDAIPGAVSVHTDHSMGMERTEVLCATCGSHLGHRFDDGPTKTGMRYCMNGVCLAFDDTAEPQKS